MIRFFYIFCIFFLFVLSNAFGESANNKNANNLNYIITKAQKLASNYHSSKAMQYGHMFEDLYFQHFEGALENDITAHFPKITPRAEFIFDQLISLSYRKHGAELPILAHQLKIVLQKPLNFYKTQSFNTIDAFLSAFIILFREGGEALLLVSGLIIYCRKLECPYQSIYIGSFLGILSSFLMAYVVYRALLGLSLKTLELVEGIGFLVTAGLLLYIGLWIFSKREIEKWRMYLQKKIQSGKDFFSFSLLLTAWLAVFREGAETVLFYQTLLFSHPNGIRLIIIGFIVAICTLYGLYILVSKYSLRLPLRYFFSITSVFFAILSVVFVGNGLQTLQTIGLLSARAIAYVPIIPYFGIYPTVETLVGQCLFALILLFTYLKLIGRSSVS